MKQKNKETIPKIILAQETRTKSPAKKYTKPFSHWLKRNWYYHKLVRKMYALYVPENSSVLHVNCANGYLFDTIKPSIGVGIDADAACIEDAQKKYPMHRFYAQTLDELPVSHQFDYIILSFVTMETDDIQKTLEQLHRFCHPGTRIIVESYSYLWEPILWFTKKLHLRRPTHFKNWVSSYDLQNFLRLADFQPITHTSRILCPMYIPLISFLFNNVIAHVPFMDRLCLNNWLIARPNIHAQKTDATVSVIITCKNEAGNIKSAVKRCPQMGKNTEIIFVEGGSTDNTLQEIKQVTQQFPEKNIRWFVQDGKGKGDAVRKAFEKARGDILMILDGDLTTPPEELPKFFNALINRKGEFINGSRLIYCMEPEAMMFLALIANYFFGLLFSWILGQRVKDTLCGTKVLWKKDYERIAQNRTFFGLLDPFGDFDLLLGAARLNLTIIDVPVHYKQRTYGKTNIRHFKEVWLLLWMSIKAALKFKIM